AEIRDIQKEARTGGFKKRRRWPMIVLRTPKGWTGTKEGDGKPTEGTFRSHQVPRGERQGHPAHGKLLAKWMKSYRPDEALDAEGRCLADLEEPAPRGTRRRAANPHANGGILLRDLRLPDFRKYAVKVARPGAVDAEATRVQGQYLRDVMKM